jgi:hypothetical protein
MERKIIGSLGKMRKRDYNLISQRLFLGRGTTFAGSPMWTGSGLYTCKDRIRSDINSSKSINKTKHSTKFT